MRGKKNEEQDWEPRYGNESRPWLLGFSQSEPLTTSTTSKETYTADWPPSPSKEGVRRQLLRKALWDEIQRVVVAKLSQRHLGQTENNRLSNRAFDTAAGVRRQLLRKALWDEMRKEVVAELNRPEEALPAGTEYNESYIKEGFTPCPINTTSDLHRQYPLYGGGVGAGGLSLWRERFPKLEGATYGAHIAHPFHRSTAFTKPLDEIYEETNQPR